MNPVQLVSRSRASVNISRSPLGKGKAVPRIVIGRRILYRDYAVTQRTESSVAALRSSDVSASYATTLVSETVKGGSSDRDT